MFPEKMQAALVLAGGAAGELVCLVPGELEPVRRRRGRFHWVDVGESWVNRENPGSRGPGRGRPLKRERCHCGKMTKARAAAKFHHC